MCNTAINILYPLGLLVTIVVIEVLGRKKTMAFENIIAMVGFLLLFVCSNS